MNQPLNSTWQIASASFIGGPLAGFYLLHKNYNTLGQSSSAKLLLKLGVVFTSLLVFLAIFAPKGFTGILLATIYSLLIKVYAEKKQSKYYSTHIENGGFKASQWQWFMTSIASITITFVVAIIVALLLMIFAPDILPDRWPV